ncbi:MAG: hypothetical protein ACI8QD_002477 [Cyclobacteriaceae bacterium]|jgi:hypothetical protein
MEQRPAIPKAKVTTDTGQEEAFQNTVLRPIIKMKHDLLTAHTKHYIANKKQDFALLSLEKKLIYVTSCFEQDQTLRSELRGMVIGQYTVEEYENYGQMSNALNKRIINIIKERMVDHINILSH